VDIIPPGGQDKAPELGPTFSGGVFPLATARPEPGVAITTIDFSPASRTYWHHHERGQVLVVLAGRGLVQSRGGAVREIRAGDTVWVPPGEQHWHGAGPESSLVHTAISLGRTEWDREVSEEEYGPPEASEKD
jgi:quercetin dioxygenase-like cupin family protein